MCLRTCRASVLDLVSRFQATNVLATALGARLFGTNIAMGEGCCGGDTGVQAQTVEDVNGVSETTTSKAHADFLAERQPFYKKRIDLFEQYFLRQQQEFDAARAAEEKIKVVLPDGKEKEAVKGATTPMDIAKGISSGLAKKVVVASVDGEEWDINRPLMHDCALKLFSAADPEGQDVRTSSTVYDVHLLLFLDSHFQ
jgi:hypothetical protein